MPGPATSSRPTVTLAVDRQGRAEVHKRAAGSRAEQLAREATALRHGRHPGVVEVLDLRQDGEATVLVTRCAGTHTLASWRPATLDEVAGVLAAVAETLADLHHLGVVHGAVRAEHVVLDRDGHPVLCGFERAGDHRPADDVAALAELTRQLVEGVAPTDGARRLGAGRSSGARRRLLGLANEVRGADPSVRHGARRYAAAVLAAVPSAAVARPEPSLAAALPVEKPTGPSPAGDRAAAAGRPAAPPADDGRGDGPDDATGGATDRRPGGEAIVDRAPAAPPGARPRRGGLAALGVLGATAVLVGAATTWTGARPELEVGAAPAPTLPVVPAPAPPAPRPAGTAPAATTEAAPPVAEPAPPCVAPEGCPVVRLGGVVDHGGRSYAVGTDADEVLLAPPGCPDPPALALLRPDGATYLFDGWPEPGGDVTPRRGPVVAPGSRWQAGPVDDRGCPALAVVGPDGTVVAIDGAPR